MKSFGLLMIVLLLAIGSLFLGLEMGKSQLNQTESLQVQTETDQNSQSLSSPLTSESGQIITELKNEVKQLKQALAEKTDLIDSMNSSMGLLEQQVEIAYTEIDAASEQDSRPPFTPEPASITVEQASMWVPEPYANVVAGQQGDMVVLFKRHHQANANQDWASDREQTLADSIANSEYAEGVNIESINCKTTTCEIRGIELSPNAWMQVSQQVQGSKLGKNVSTWSYLAGDEDGNTLIYMLSEVDDTQDSNTESQ